MKAPVDHHMDIIRNAHKPCTPLHSIGRVKIREKHTATIRCVNAISKRINVLKASCEAGGRTSGPRLALAPEGHLRFSHNHDSRERPLRQVSQHLTDVRVINIPSAERSGIEMRKTRRIKAQTGLELDNLDVGFPAKVVALFLCLFPVTPASALTLSLDTGKQGNAAVGEFELRQMHLFTR